ncbi:MAG: hypothetical protein ACYDHD_01490 [Vulcanimicrobiaceae bacterium]
MPKSKKPEVFEHLFHWRYDTGGERSPRWDEVTQTMPEDRRLVYSHEVLKAIVATKTKLGDNQAANFTKDFLRKKSRSTNWPKSLADLRWTMKQVTGKDASSGFARNFLFKPYADGQTDPFPDEWPIPANFERHAVQSVTLSFASKQIARLDEPRLMQIAVDLRVVETHVALFSPLSTDQYKVVHMDHLQMGLKLRGSEIDGLYLAEFQDEKGTLHPALITVEAKKHDEFVNSSQIVAQVEHASGLGVTVDLIVPLALKHADGGMFIFEYAPFEPPQGAPFERDSVDADDLKCVKVVFYSIEPKVIGLSGRVRRPKTTKRKDDQLVHVETKPDPDLLDEGDDEDDEE